MIRSFSRLCPNISKWDNISLRHVLGARKKTLDEVYKTHDFQAFTLTEKTLYSHCTMPKKKIKRGSTYLLLQPDRVVMQDATAQMALLQFMTAEQTESAVPTSIHCDHLITAQGGREKDLTRANQIHKEVYSFLESASKKYGIAFWEPGSGIIHQIVLEHYAFPGGLIIGTDSHTPNAGGLASAAIGVGGADVVDVMTGTAWELKAPKVMGVHLSGNLSAWCTAKDVILHLADHLSVKGATGYVLEYYGKGVDTLSATGMATIANMGAELGATTSIFPYTKATENYLKSTGREDMLPVLAEYRDMFRPDPRATYDKIISINLNTIAPRVNGPFTPDVSNTIGENLAKACKMEDWPLQLSSGLIGSCTNSSYEDMKRCAQLVNKATGAGLRFPIPFYVTPGSKTIQTTLEEEGIMKSFEEAGAIILANACGPCIGQWDRNIVAETKNSIITSYNRNFAKRNDGNPCTHTFIASPETATMLAFAGRLDFDPRSDSIPTPEGSLFRFTFPITKELPKKPFSPVENFSILRDNTVEVNIHPNSNRLASLVPFPKQTGEQFRNMPILIKVSGKCTTDHISMAGPWLKYRGHLDNISNNMLIGATNASNNRMNWVKNQFSQKYGKVPDVAREYKKAGKTWVVIAEHNYGEGSSREHAALQPRHLGCGMIIAKSFARIHETNLKKQGILPLTFQNESDYANIHPDDAVDVLDFDAICPNSVVKIKVGTEIISLNHSLNHEQINWFRYGSALNYRAQSKLLN